MSTPDQGSNVRDLDFPVWETDGGGIVRLSQDELRYIWYVVPTSGAGSSQGVSEEIPGDLTLTAANEPARLQDIKSFRGESAMALEEDLYS